MTIGRVIMMTGSANMIGEEEGAKLERLTSPTLQTGHHRDTKASLGVSLMVI